MLKSIDIVNTLVSNIITLDSNQIKKIEKALNSSSRIIVDSNSIKTLSKVNKVEKIVSINEVTKPVYYESEKYIINVLKAENIKGLPYNFNKLIFKLENKCLYIIVINEHKCVTDSFKYYECNGRFKRYTKKLNIVNTKARSLESILLSIIAKLNPSLDEVSKQKLIINLLDDEDVLDFDASNILKSKRNYKVFTCYELLDKIGYVTNSANKSIKFNKGFIYLDDLDLICNIYNEFTGDRAMIRLGLYDYSVEMKILEII